MANTYYPNGYAWAANATAGTEFTLNGVDSHVLDLLESTLTHPTHADGFVDSGDPVVAGNITGVAEISAAAATDYVGVNTNCGRVLSVIATDENGSSAVAIGDLITINTITAVLSKARNVSTQLPFAIALSTLSGGSTGNVALFVIQGLPIGQRDLASYMVPLTEFRIHDDVATGLPATASSNNFGLVNGTYLTSAPYLLSETARNTTATDCARA